MLTSDRIDTVGRAVAHVVGPKATYADRVDDLKQEAQLLHLELVRRPGGGYAGLDDAAQERYLFIVVKRRWLRKELAAFGPAPLQPDTGYLEHALAASGPGAAVEISRLVREAPPEIGQYLSSRVLLGLGWNDTRRMMGISNAALAALRRTTASWLMAQYEGQRCDRQ